MSQSSNDRLQFSINESVWLRDDAPAEEILSMALEPDITVEESWNDVTIKGYLRLTGEYKPADSKVLDEEGSTAPFRTIDEIMETNNGTAVLEHHFPIDITIPADRVPNLEDLFVIIESFDYELAEHRHIQLQADLAITGLAQPAANPAGRSEVPTPPAEAPIAAQPPETPVQPPAPEEAAPKPEKPEKSMKKAPAAKAVDKKTADPVKAADKKINVPVNTADKKATAPAQKEKASKGKKADAKSSETAAPSSQKKEAEKAQKSAVKAGGAENKKTSADKKEKSSKKSRDLSDYPLTDSPAEFDEMPTDKSGIEQEEPFAPFEYQAFRKPEKQEDTSREPQVAFSERSEAPAPVPVTPPAPAAPAAPAQTPPEANTEQPEEEPSEANSLYLTKVLAGEEAEQKTLVKIYIVQNGDSLESISERYKVPVTSLLRKNELPTATIEAGELLYIPKSAKGNPNG
ncbi:MAG: LysM peptidoglycan-binding domain-containing protein [Sporolactobacillus sp.]